jgi:hypothetical protein
MGMCWLAGVVVVMVSWFEVVIGFRDNGAWKSSCSADHFRQGERLQMGFHMSTYNVPDGKQHALAFVVRQPH